MPNGRGLPGVVGGKPPRRTMWTRLAGGVMRDRAVAGERRVGAGDALAALAVAGGAVVGVQLGARARVPSGATARRRLAAPRRAAVGQAVQVGRPSPRGRRRSGTASIARPPRPSAPARAARRHAGLQQRDDLARRPVADAGLGVVLERGRVPVLDRDQAAGEVERAGGRAEDVAARVAGVAVAERLDEVGAAVPLRRPRAVGLELRRPEEQRAPDRERRLLVEREVAARAAGSALATGGRLCR